MTKRVAGLMLMPKYVDRFTCLGGDCEDTCCSSWRVDLDRTSVRAYQASQDPELAPLFAQHVRLNPAPRTARTQGHIEMLDTPCGECPFLDGGGLCRIQARLGESALSDTCASYPRSTVRFGDLLQSVLQLSCPEVARLALLAPDAFDLEAREDSVRSGSLMELLPKGGLSQELMEEVRTQLFQILRTTALDLSKRLAVIGFFCLRLTELLEQGKAANLPGLFQATDALLETGAEEIPLKALDEREFARVRFAWVHLLTMVQAQVAAPHQRRVIDAACAGLSIRADGSRDELALLQGFEVGTARLALALEAVPFLLEHYLYNEALKGLFPWQEETPHRHFINLLLNFTVLRVMLVGRAASQEATLTPQELAETVQVFARRMQNGKKLVDQLDPACVGGDWTRLGTLLTVV